MIRRSDRSTHIREKLSRFVRRRLVCMMLPPMAAPPGSPRSDVLTNTGSPAVPGTFAGLRFGMSRTRRRHRARGAAHRRRPSRRAATSPGTARDGRTSTKSTAAGRCATPSKRTRAWARSSGSVGENGTHRAAAGRTEPSPPASPRAYPASAGLCALPLLRVHCGCGCTAMIDIRPRWPSMNASSTTVRARVGAGGKNVNKVATAVELASTWPARPCPTPSRATHCLAGKRMTGDGVLLIDSASTAPSAEPRRGPRTAGGPDPSGDDGAVRRSRRDDQSAKERRLTTEKRRAMIKATRGRHSRRQ